MANPLVKHLKMVGPYLRMSVKFSSEYKFQFITNFFQFIVFMIVWIVFWKIIVNRMGAVGDWEVPMLAMLVGFSYMVDALWTVFWYTSNLPEEILLGNLDIYLVRPIHAIYGVLMKRIEIFNITPAFVGLAIVIWTLFTHYSWSTLRFFLALLVILFVAVAIIFHFISIGMLAFWFGRTAAFRGIYRGFKFFARYPITIFGPLAMTFFTLAVPQIFIGTYPVLMLVDFSIAQCLYVVLQIFLLMVISIAVSVIVWKKGIRRYESHGG